VGNLIKFFTTTLLGIAYSVITLADNAPQNNPTQTAPKNIPSFCPPPSQLVKVGDYWQSNSAWKSDIPTSGTKILNFLGAQWIGIKVGKIICLYQDAEKYSFPVALLTVHPTLVFEPTNTSWIKTPDSYRKCISNNIDDCPFFVEQNVLSNNNNPYEQIKYSPKPLTTSPFVE
jgi:hypothetical protein